MIKNTLVPLSLLLTLAVSAPTYAQELNSSTTTGAVSILAGDELGGSKFSSRRTTDPLLQGKVDYAGAETAFITVTNEVGGRYTSYGVWKFKVDYPNFYAISKAGNKIKLGAFSRSGAYIAVYSTAPYMSGRTTRPSAIYFVNPSLNGVKPGWAGEFLRGASTFTTAGTCRYTSRCTMSSTGYWIK